AFAILRRCRDVVRIAAHAEADQLRVDARAALLRVLELFEDDRAAAIGEHEPVAIAIPRPARLGRLLIASGQRFRLPESTKAARRGGHLAAAGDDEIRVAVLNGAHAETDGVRRRRASRDDAEVRSAQVVLDGQVPGDHVDDRSRHEERGNLARVALRLEILAVLRLDRPEPADTRAADGAAALRHGLRE